VSTSDDVLAVRSSPVRRVARVLLVVAAVFVGVPAACNAVWRLQHPSPLGRSSTAVAETLARDLPPGTPLSVATAYLERHGVRFTVDSANGERNVEAMVDNVSNRLPFTEEDVFMHLSFDAQWRLTTHYTRSVLTGL
jgi:hypothetical protein